MTKLVFILASLLAFTSCQKFQDRFSAVGYRCGMASVSGAVVQVLAPDGQMFAMSPDNVKAFWINSERKASPVSLNASGCMQLPPEDGILEVSVSLPAGAVRREFTMASALRFESLRLIPDPALAVQKRCPDDIIYANDRLFFPFGFSKTGDLSNVEISLWARPQSDGSPLRLWQKPFGDAEVITPEKLDISSLAEGNHELQIHWQELSTGPDPAQSSPCKLLVQRSVPVLKGLPLTSNVNPKPVAQNTILPWSSQNSEDSLWLCRTRLQNPLRELPDADCQNANRYKPAQLIVADQDGLWQYCLMAEDRAGNRSAPACEQLLISSTAPRLQVQWADADLKGEWPLLKRPYAKIQASVQVEHPLLPQADLETSLQCKVELSMGPDIVSKGGSVLCASGACAGQDLSEFRSCPPDLTLELTNLWTKALERRSRMTLRVRADDGAGQTTEATAQLWIHDGAWYAEPMFSGGFGIPSDEKADQVILDHKKQPWVVTRSEQERGPRAYRWDGKTWQLSWDIPRGNSWPRIELIDGIGRLFGVVQGWEDGDQFYEFGDSETWVPIPPPREGFHESCAGLKPVAPEGLVCVTAKTVFIWQEQKWTAIDRPKDGDTSPCSELDSMIIVDQGRIWMPCTGIMYLYSGGLWRKCPSPDIDVIEYIRRDGRGRVWAQTAFPFYENNGVGYFTEDGTWHATGSERGLPASLLGQRMLVVGREGQVHYGSYLWNESTLQWESFQNAGLRAFDISGKALPGLQGEAWIAINAQSTLVELNSSRPLVWDLPAERMKYEGTDPAFRDKDGELWLQLSDEALAKPELYRVRESRFLEWDEKLFGFNVQGDWFLNQMKMDAKGRFWLLRSGRLYLYEEGSWRFQANFSAPVPGRLLPAPSGRLFLGAPGALYEWTDSGPVLLDTIPGSQLFLSQLAEDGDGTMWFRADTSDKGEVYRLRQAKLEKMIFADPAESPDGFLGTHILTVAGRVLIMNKGRVWTYDPTQDRFLALDSEEFSFQPGDGVDVHVLDLERTLVQVVRAAEGFQSLTLYSRKSFATQKLPLMPDQRFLKFAVSDRDGLIWASDASLDHLYRWSPSDGWTMVLGPSELKRRLRHDRLETSDMVPAPEGGIFLQRNSFPLLRFLPAHSR